MGQVLKHANIIKTAREHLLHYRGMDRHGFARQGAAEHDRYSRFPSVTRWKTLEAGLVSLIRYQVRLSWLAEWG